MVQSSSHLCITRIADLHPRSQLEKGWELGKDSLVDPQGRYSVESNPGLVFATTSSLTVGHRVLPHRGSLVVECCHQFLKPQDVSEPENDGSMLGTEVETSLHSGVKHTSRCETTPLSVFRGRWPSTYLWK
jgi:hypothetical protein